MNNSFVNDREMYDRAVMVVLANQSVSAWLLERYLLISDIRATGLLATMESRGVVGPLLANGERKVLLQRETFEMASRLDGNLMGETSEISR
jgi:S-DNA-T family DNA segregation ATPase FtsK/SpoIIIE